MNNPKDYALLQDIGETIDVAGGTVLWQQGDEADHMLLVLDGTLEITREESDGDLVVIRRLGRGSLMGESSLDGGRRSAGARAPQACRLVRIKAARFRELVSRQPQIYEKLFWEQVERVRSLTDERMSTHREAITDVLTGLYNVGFFKRRLESEIARAAATSDLVSVAMFDVDHFKHYNDTQGHPAGDRVLTNIAGAFRKASRRGDIVARYGGEEFVFLLYGASTDESLSVADHVRQMIELLDLPGAAEQPLGAITVSCGVATYPNDATNAADLVEAADRNLYNAKRGGRNRVVAMHTMGGESHVPT